MKLIFSLVGLLGVGAAIFHFTGMIYNTTNSYPPGFYQVNKNVFPSVGDMALFCPPHNDITKLAIEREYLKPGFCASGTIPMIKRIAAGEGDYVRVTDEGIAINDDGLIPNTAAFKSDSLDGSLPIYTGGEIQKNMLLMLSEHNPKSWDSRYFGPVSEALIIGKVKPIYTWSN